MTVDSLNQKQPTPAPIVFCITELKPGGAERCLVELACRIDRQRFQPTVYCLGPPPGGNANSLVERLAEAQVPTHFFGARRAFQAPAVMMRIRRQLAVDSPAIFQSFLFHASVLGTICARMSRVPSVITNIRVAERRPNLHLALSRWTDRFVSRHVCVSESVRDFMKQHGLSEPKMVVIPNGVDLARFDSVSPLSLETLGGSPGRRALLYLGRLDEQKGLNWLFGILPDILSKLPSHDLLLVGDGPQRPQLERAASGSTVSDRIHFLGYRRHVPEILAASDLLLLPSRWEGMPNVVLEAMASRKPIVTTRVEGISELLGPQTEAQSVELDDAEGFISRVVQIASDVQLAASLGAENRRRVETNFQLDAMVAAYESLYEEQLAN